MEVFCQDTKLNLSPYYLKPGFAFGGSCLPKDLRAITYKARELDVNVPLLGSILLSNQHQIERAIDIVLSTGKKNVGVLGLSFKQGTDDLRESPMVTLIERLIGKGLRLMIYDRDVEMARISGANKEFIEREIPHISSLMQSNLDEVVGASEVLIIGKKDEEFRNLAERVKPGCVVIDLVRMFDQRTEQAGYEGICW
jgi:GDP-mannose 6-dehydrogenase